MLAESLDGAIVMDLSGNCLRVGVLLRHLQSSLLFLAGKDACVTAYGRGQGVGRGRGLGRGRTAGKTLTTPVIAAKQCKAQKYWYMPGCVKVNSYTKPCVVKDSGLTVHVIRRTKLPIGGAGRATGDTVRIARPGPAHGVAHADVDDIRQKTEFVF